jgi:uncharacterized protein
MSEITVHKLDLQGRETWRYSGRVLERGASYVLLEARFNREDTPFHGMVLRRGDRFVETFYTDRFYNIFEMHSASNDHLYGWYCNIGMPAKIEQDLVSYVDLALDLLVYPDGTQLVLDQDEFERLPLEPHIRQMALEGLKELQERFTNYLPK